MNFLSPVAATAGSGTAAPTSPSAAVGTGSEGRVEPISRRRKIAAVVTLFVGLFLTATILSFDPADPPCTAAYPPNMPLHNWCGTVGAYVSHAILSSIGDGAYPALLFLLTGAFLWMSRLRTEDKAFRVVGGALLVLDVSVASAMITVQARLPESNGGVLGLGIWQFLEPRLGPLGTVLLLMVPVALVGLILLTDTWFVMIPLALFRWVREKARRPYERLAASALAMAGAGAGGAVADVSEETDDEPHPIVRKQRRTEPAAAAKDEKEEADEDEVSEAAARRKARKQAKDEDAAEAEKEPVKAKGKKSVEKELDKEEEEEDEDEKEEAEKPAAPPMPARPIVIRHNRPTLKPKEEAQEDEDFAFTPLPSTPHNQDYQLPPVDLLEEPVYIETGDQEAHIREQAETLTKTLAEFGITASVVAIETGPVVTQYELALAPGIKVGKVIGLSDDIAIGLKAPSVRIVAPLLNKDTIGVEVPNTSRQVVKLKEIVLGAKDASQRMGLPLFLGKDSTGDPLVRDLAGMPHLLIAGTTGSGKSVCLNSVIMSLLLTRTPIDLKLVLIDPKMVELSVFNRLPHLMCPVVTDMRKAEAILNWLVDQMDERYRALSQAGVRNIASYNRLSREEIIAKFQPKTPEEEARLTYHMPHICVIVDELADLMMVAAKEVESHVTRLSQKSRAVGIHLVMATQRPSVDVLTGLIKSNLPWRVSFQVASRIDSRTILDSMGAEKLLGQGDMLLLTPGAARFTRAQGAFVSDQDIQKVIDFVTQKAEPEFQRELVQIKVKDDDSPDRAPGGGMDEESLLALCADDALYNQAIEIVLEHQLIDQMAEDGIVGQYKGSQAREVLLTLEQWHALKEQRRTDETPKDSHLSDEEAALES